MQPCSDVREALSARLDSEPTPLSPERIAAHLAECAGCSAAERALGALRERTGRLPRATAPASLHARVRDLAESPSPEAARVRRAGARAALGWIHAVARRPALAVAPLIVVALVVTTAFSLSGAFTPRVVRAMVADHLRHDAQHEPFSVASQDPVVVAAYFHQRLPAYKVFDAVPAVHAPLDGGRLCKVCGEAAAHLSYHDPRHGHLSVFVLHSHGRHGRWGRTVQHHDRTYELARCRGCWVASWETNGVRCAVVAHSTPEHVLAEAENVRRALRHPAPA